MMININGRLVYLNGPNYLEAIYDVTAYNLLPSYIMYTNLYLYIILLYCNMFIHIIILLLQNKKDLITKCGKYIEKY